MKYQDNRINEAILSAATKELRGYSLRVFIDFISDAPDFSASTTILSKRTGIRQSHVSRAISSLIKKNWLYSEGLVRKKDKTTGKFTSSNPLRLGSKVLMIVDSIKASIVDSTTEPKAFPKTRTMLLSAQPREIVLAEVANMIPALDEIEDSFRKYEKINWDAVKAMDNRLFYDNGIEDEFKRKQMIVKYFDAKTFKEKNLQ